MKENQKYFVSIEVKWGKQDGETQVAESTGGQNWGQLDYGQSIAVQSILVPHIAGMMEDSIELGKAVAGIDIPKTRPSKTRG